MDYTINVNIGRAPPNGACDVAMKGVSPKIICYGEELSAGSVGELLFDSWLGDVRFCLYKLRKQVSL